MNLTWDSATKHTPNNHPAKGQQRRTNLKQTSMQDVNRLLQAEFSQKKSLLPCGILSGNVAEWISGIFLPFFTRGSGPVDILKQSSVPVDSGRATGARDVQQLNTNK